EFYSVSNRCQPPFSPLSIYSTEALPAPSLNIQLIDYQGVFRFDCAGSGANYRDIKQHVKDYL
ncbi:hypothetical protein, partial [Pseudomonas defluvii]|uniref:hypothetical protein n=1 Tax=Pseudomonas defluvii TaxID=1876757 RepID=UPI003905A108